RVWQVVPTAQRPLAPAWLVGTLVHAALALWRFPGAGFDAWVTARAREYGQTDTQQLEHARAATARLLARLRQHPRFGDMARAERRLHEVPYSYVRSGQVETGYVDLLYRVDGAWRLVDFKTDRVADEAALRRILAQTDYRAQVQGYGTAVRRLLGVEARLELCWLDYGGEVRFTALFPPLSPLPKGGEIGSPPPLGED
ncbi:MAG: PD-(D/E)XK nuclease family protein, partial [Anaerolineales bacterium]|nr:PD-(D/E)XK nuclease family protein [Anaerolineales bacterium]